MSHPPTEPHVETGGREGRGRGEARKKRTTIHCLRRQRIETLATGYQPPTGFIVKFKALTKEPLFCSFSASFHRFCVLGAPEAPLWSQQKVSLLKASALPACAPRFTWSSSGGILRCWFYSGRFFACLTPAERRGKEVFESVLALTTGGSVEAVIDKWDATEAHGACLRKGAQH